MAGKKETTLAGRARKSDGLGSMREKLRQDVLNGPMSKMSCLRDEGTKREQMELWKQVGFRLNAKTHANGNSLDTEKLTRMKNDVQYTQKDDSILCGLRGELRHAMLDGLRFGSRWQWSIAWQLCKDIEQYKLCASVANLEAACSLIGQL